MKKQIACYRGGGAKLNWEIRKNGEIIYMRIYKINEEKYIYIVLMFLINLYT